MTLIFWTLFTLTTLHLGPPVFYIQPPRRPLPYPTTPAPRHVTNLRSTR